VTERIGVKLHILSRLIQRHDARRGAEREQQPKRRGSIATFLRAEHRDLLKSDSPDSSMWRFRARLELAYPFNRPRVTADGTVYATSDTEFFVPLSNDPLQGQVNQWRVRNGVGYRMNFRTRLEALYIWTTRKDTDTRHFATDSQVLDVRLKLAF
jgi:hypothetical protein